MRTSPRDGADVIAAVERVGSQQLIRLVGLIEKRKPRHIRLSMQRIVVFAQDVQEQIRDYFARWKRMHRSKRTP